MVPAPVGFQCQECVKRHTRATRQNQGVFGGEVSRNPRQTSIILIAINVVVWGAIQMAGFVNLQTKLVEFLGLIPQGICLATDNPAQYYPGVTQSSCQMMSDGTWMAGVATGAWWQVFTSIFTQVTIMHIAMNCLTLWFLGPTLESYLGRVRFLVTYMVAGLFGSLAVCWLSDPASTSYGGSGSLFGLMGALLIIFWRQKQDMKQLLMWLALNVLITFIGGGISWQAHMGGLAGGLLLALVWALVPQSQSRNRTQGLMIAALVVVAGAGIVARSVALA